MTQQFYEMLKDWIGLNYGYNKYDSVTGKLTNRYGVSASDSNLESITIDDALKIHLKKYYNTLELERFYPSIALALFDAAMMHGMEFARKLTEETDEMFPGDNEYKALYHIAISRLHDVFTHNFRENGLRAVNRIILLNHYIENIGEQHAEK